MIGRPVTPIRKEKRLLLGLGSWTAVSNPDDRDLMKKIF
jgi:hypothetical protein